MTMNAALSFLGHTFGDDITGTTRDKERNTTSDNQLNIHRVEWIGHVFLGC